MNDGDKRAGRTLGIALALLAGTVALFEFSNLDLNVQDRFYHPRTGRWVVDEKEPVARAIFYDGPKAVVGIIGLGALILALGPPRWREKRQFNQRGLWLAVLAIVTVPAVVALGKHLTNAFCPSEIRRYGGDVPYTKICEPFPAGDRPTKRGECYPAGHASGGFALLGMVALRSSRRWRAGVIALGLGLGWWIGFYQMLKGAHYLSDTITSMLVAWIVVLLWQRILRIAPA